MQPLVEATNSLVHSFEEIVFNCLLIILFFLRNGYFRYIDPSNNICMGMYDQIERHVHGVGQKNRDLLNHMHSFKWTSIFRGHHIAVRGQNQTQ